MACRSFLHVSGSLEKLETLQRKLFPIGAANPWSLEGFFLPALDHVALLVTPAVGLTFLLVLIAFPDKALDLLVDEGLHDQSTCRLLP